jgi:hypothetical protein
VRANDDAVGKADTQDSFTGIGHLDRKRIAAMRIQRTEALIYDDGASFP